MKLLIEIPDNTVWLLEMFKSIPDLKIVAITENSSNETLIVTTSETTQKSVSEFINKWAGAFTTDEYLTDADLDKAKYDYLTAKNK